MPRCHEVASFRGDDDPRLVAASLACRVCLSGDVLWTLEGREWEAEAECRCGACGHAWTVGLTSDQALRLSLQPLRSPVEA